MTKKLIAIDLDGTFLGTDPERNVYKSATEAIQKAVSNGHTVVPATGRGRPYTGLYLPYINERHGIFCNGAHVVIDGKTAYEKTFSLEGCSFLSFVQEHNLSFCASSDGRFYCINTDDDLINYSKTMMKAEELFLQIDDKDTKFYELYCWGKNFEKLSEAVIPKGSYLINSHNAKEITPIGVNKGRALEELASQLNFSMSDTIAIGDGPNDIEMLQMAGIGIAMGNGIKTAKEKADMVTTHVDEDGLYNAFKMAGVI